VPATNIQNVYAEILDYGDLEWSVVLRSRAHNANFAH
jgi:hypothetical protein